MSWQVGTGNEQIYRYAYDYLDRLASAQMTGNTYRTAYSYDPRGNLLTLDRYDANGTMIDDLEYFNYSGTNRINTIVDSGTPAGFDKGNAIVFAAYNYDANGNLSHDPFKNLDFAYNHLNLPDTIIQPGSNSRIVYLYDAAGNKLHKEVLNDSIILTGPFTENQYQARFITTDGQPTALDSTLLVAEDSIVFKPGFHAKSGLRLTAKIDSTLVPIDQTDYIGGIEYRNGDIQAIYHPQGRAVPDGSTWRHEYVITDHLGNTRLRFSDLDANTFIDSTEILDEITYYPFGSPWQDAGYRYTYNGKELDRELGLRWHHYGRRMFDPVIARFTGVDPISDQFAGLSTFNYAANNPVTGIDLHGLQFVNANDAKIIIHNGGASLKRSNLSRPTNARINNAKVISGVDANGRAYLTTTFPTRLGSLNFQDNQLERRKAVDGPGIVTEVNDRFSGNSRQRRKQRRALQQKGLEPGSRTVTPVPTGGGKGGRGIGAVWLFAEGLNFVANQMVKSDLKTAETQFNEFGGELQIIVNEGVSSGLIPEELRTGQILGDIANYIFQGEFTNTYDKTTQKQLLEISQKLIIENGIKCDQCR